MEIVSVRIGVEADIPRVRQVSDVIARSFSFENFARTRMITAILEITRNALQHGRGGRAYFQAERKAEHTWLKVVVEDQGDGLPDDSVFVKSRRPFRANLSQSRGMGLGLTGVQSLADSFDLRSSKEGTTAELAFQTSVPARELESRVEDVREKLGDLSATDPVAELSRQNRELAEAMAERELLIDEVHHRTGNNLSLIISFIQLSKRNAKEEETREAMAQLEARVHSVAKVHQELQRAHLGERISLLPLLENVARHAQDAFSNPEFDISISVFGDNANVVGAAAIDLGLIVNELVTNSYKHAFAGRQQGKVQIAFERGPDDEYWELSVQDDGGGIPEDMKPERSDSLGWRMVRAMATRHAGKITTSGEKGFRTSIKFPPEFASAGRDTSGSASSAE
ncbi:sensor histidine kinase [Aurantiacibacter rhizosphaerae]|nr:ATP-binding protein [Aurantiacibacter rhizosphaerae]